MLIIPGNELSASIKELMIKEIYEAFGIPNLNLSSFKNINSLPALESDDYYLLHNVFIIKGKTKIDRREVFEIKRTDLEVFLAEYIEPEVEGLDLFIISLDKKELVFTNHDGDIWIKQIRE